AADYWTKSSSKPYLLAISIPTLIINAENDPFLARQCYPFQEVNSNPYLDMMVPKYGGHVGFIESVRKLEITWAEKEIIRFIST
ncbi:MAG: putative alpha/beta-fold hydrolase, partial [Halieaceae bacterium]